MTFQGRLLAAVLALGCVSAWAQTTYPESEYKKLIRVDEEINPLGENPFGESVSLYDGSFSFTQTDISVPGIGPSIEITRTFKADGDIPLRQGNGAFGDWDIEIPRLTTLTSNSGDHIGWVVNSLNYTDRCTNMGEPPWILMGRPGSPPIFAEEWWNEGYRLNMPGAGSQDVLVRSDANPLVAQKPGFQFVATTKENWMVGCLDRTANGEPGEAFVALSPDGTLYRLNYLVYRDARDFVIFRKTGKMLATSVEDRFGNWVHYSYNAGKLTSIDASDGRQVTLGYNGDGTQIAQINIVAGGQTRTWSYDYRKTVTGYTLTSVTLPDGSKWSYQFENLGYEVKSYMEDMPRNCPDPKQPEILTVSGTVTGPSGLTGVFEARPMRHGRSAVPEMCEVPPRDADQRGYLRIPRYYNNLALTKKRFTGAGIPALEWTYAYPTAIGSWSNQCGSGCATSNQVDVKDPAGNITRYTFSNRFDATEGKLLRTDYYSGAASGTPLRSELINYANPVGGPWPTQYGYSMVLYLNSDKIEQQIPVRSKVILQDGDTYVWEATAFNEFAQVTQTNRYNSIAGQQGVQERTTYLNDRPHWVLGLPLQVDNITTGETVSRSEYELNNVTLSKRWRFGQLAMTYGYNEQGLLASFTDPNNRTTTLNNYKRGIPQSIGYPDGTSQSLVVDDLGRINSITDQAGNTTGYGYDLMGRLIAINYPWGDETSWYPKSFSYEYVTAAERGVAGGHWRRTVSKGDSRIVSYFDAMLRPVMSDTYIVTDGGSHVTTRTDYDWKGQKTFVSYPVSGTPDLGGIGNGTYSLYDPLGRLIRIQQASEAGWLTTTTNYLSGASKQVIDPKSNSTTTRYQVFDQPAYEAVIEVLAPESTVQVITRDTYGNPLEITQGSQYGGGVQVPPGGGTTMSMALMSSGGTTPVYNGVTKTFTYDASHRLCRTFEPESANEIKAYDAADNVAWSASGLAISGAGCGYEQVPTAARTTRSYDAMNRLKTLVPPSGTQSSAYTYDALGNVQQVDSGVTTWSATRNKLGQITSETLAVIGNGFNVIRYAHDSYGGLRSITYPDALVVDYAPDALGRPTKAGTFASGISYHPDGEIAHFMFGNGTDYMTQKNARQLLSNFSYVKGGVVSLSEDFAYDANGNITSITDLTGGLRNKVLGYDALNRLTSAQANGLWGSESYSYDPLNNIRRRITSGQTFDYSYDATNRLATITQGGGTVMSLAYDTRGNVTNKNGNALLFDAKNQLTSIPGFGAYAYDASGRRVSKLTPSGSATYYFYTQAGQLLYQWDAAGAKTTDYIYIGKKLIARSEGSNSAVRGNIEDVYVDANGLNAAVRGWACSSNIAQSIQVHLYVGGAYGAGTFITSATANLTSEPGVATSCGVSSGSYRFSIPLSDAVRSAHASKGIYIHGISPVGNDNALISGSGNFVVPTVSAPGVPALSVPTASTSGTYSVSWSAIQGSTSYNLQEQVNGGGWVAVLSSTATSWAATAKGNGTYGYRVQACNGGGCSAWSGIGSASVLLPPPTPTGVSAPASSNGPITVTWNVSATATSYDMYQSYNNGSWVRVYSGATNSASVTVMASGAYQFFVTANNASGWSGQVGSSNVVNVTIPPGATPSISAPGSNNNGSYSVSWNGIAGAASYTLQEQVNGGAWSTVQANGANSWAASGRGSATYGYRVQACNAGGCSGWSNIANVVVSLVPGVPNFRGPYLSTKGKIDYWTVYWDAVPTATRYEIVQVQNGKTVYSGSDLSYALEYGATPYFELIYTYRMRACNALGCSAWVDVY